SSGGAGRAAPPPARPGAGGAAPPPSLPPAAPLPPRREVRLDLAGVYFQVVGVEPEPALHRVRAQLAMPPAPAPGRLRAAGPGRGRRRGTVLARTATTVARAGASGRRAYSRARAHSAWS